MDKETKTIKDHIKKVNELSLPATILIASIILGGSYYLSEANKNASIEKQQQADLQEKRLEQASAAIQKDEIANEKAACVTEAQTIAISEYEKSPTCTSNTYYTPPATCYDGVTYLTNQYNTQYNTCLQSKGLN